MPLDFLPEFEAAAMVAPPIVDLKRSVDFDEGILFTGVLLVGPFFLEGPGYSCSLSR
jgi:hypothetical protein